MRRTLCPLVLAALVGLTFAACGSSADTSTGAPSTTAAGSTTTTKKEAPVMGPKCLAVSAVLQAFLAVNTPPVDKDKVTKAVDTSVAKLKEQEKALYDTALVDSALPYLHKMANGETPTPEEKDAGTKTKDAINLFFNTTCKKTSTSQPAGSGKPAGTTTTTAKK